MKVTLEYREPYIHDRLNKYLLGFALSGISTGYYVIRETSGNQIGIRSYLNENDYYEKNEAYVQYYKDITEVNSKKDPILLHIEMADTEYRNQGLSNFANKPGSGDYFISNVYLGVYYEPTGIAKAKIFIEGLTIGNFGYNIGGCINLYKGNNEFINSDLTINKNTIKDSSEDKEENNLTSCMKPIHISQSEASDGWGENTDYVIRFALDLVKTKLETKYNYVIDSDGNKYQLILIDQLIIRGAFTNELKIYDYELDSENWKIDFKNLPTNSIIIMHSIGRTNLEEIFLNLENQILNISVLNQEAISPKSLNLYNFKISDLSNQIYGGNTFWSSTTSNSDFCSLWYYCKCLKPGNLNIINNWRYSDSYFDIKNLSAPIIIEKSLNNEITWSYPTLKISYTLVYKNNIIDSSSPFYIPYIYPILRSKGMYNFSSKLLGVLIDESSKSFCNHNYYNTNNQGYTFITGYVLIDLSSFLNKIKFFEQYLDFSFEQTDLSNLIANGLLDEQIFNITLRLQAQEINDNIYSFYFNRISLVSLSVDLLNRSIGENYKFFKKFTYNVN